MNDHALVFILPDSGIYNAECICQGYAQRVRYPIHEALALIGPFWDLFTHIGDHVPSVSDRLPYCSGISDILEKHYSVELIAEEFEETACSAMEPAGCGIVGYTPAKPDDDRHVLAAAVHEASSEAAKAMPCSSSIKLV